jgi:hypothetical protein
MWLIYGRRLTRAARFGASESLTIGSHELQGVVCSREGHAPDPSSEPALFPGPVKAGLRLGMILSPFEINADLKRNYLELSGFSKVDGMLTA